jgi:uncharacterized membrane protein
VVAIIPAESANEANSEKNIYFRWTYVVLPVAILLISIILAACFYSLLPTEVAYHFTDGSPDRWTSRSAIMAWSVVPQLFLTLIATVIVRAAITGARFWQSENTALKRILAIMGNMVALPQIILIFAMLDIFLYNAYQIHLIPVWVFALIIMASGGIALGIVLLQTVRQFRRLYGKNLQE